MVEVLPGNGVQSTLNGAITAIATTLAIQAADVASWPSSGSFRLVLNQDASNGPWEIVKVTGGQGTATLTIERASESFRGDQTAYAWADDTTVAPVITRAGLIAYLAGSTPPFKQTIIRGTGTKTTSSTSFVVIDNTNLPPLSIVLAVGDVVRCELSGQAYNNSAGQIIGFDVNVVQPTAGTVLANAACDFGAIVIAGTDRQGLTMVTTFTATEAGTHSFQPYWRVLSSTANLCNSTSGNDDCAILFFVQNLGQPAA